MSVPGAKLSFAMSGEDDDTDIGAKGHTVCLSSGRRGL